MVDLRTKVKELNWENIAAEMHENGYALVPKLLSAEQCEDLIQHYHKPNIYRKTVVMERHRFGLGEYKYFDYPLPEIVQTLRTELFPKLAPMANLWMKALKIDTVFPKSLTGFQKQCQAYNQLKPTPLILKYGKGGFNTLHQDLYGEVYFPFQTVFLLNQPSEDFEGGEFVMTEQIPRAQSKAIVMNLNKGDMLIFTTNFRPIKGKNGYFKANMKHGVSALKSGDRHTLGIIFHDALS